MSDTSDPNQKSEPVEISPEEARHDAPVPHHARKRGRTPGTLILIYGAGLVLIALVLWAFLFLFRI